MKKILIIAGAFILLAAGIILTARLFWGGGEDTWICVQGQWVKHGAPAGPPPESDCGEE